MGGVLRCPAVPHLEDVGRAENQHAMIKLRRWVSAMGALAVCCMSVAAPTAQANTPFVVQRTADGWLLRWSFASPEGAQRFASHRWQLPDNRELPYLAFLLAMTADALPEVRVKRLELQHLDAGAMSLPVVDCGVACPSNDATPVPDAPVRLEAAGIMRGVRMARVQVFPLLPTSQGWHFWLRGEVELLMPQRVAQFKSTAVMPPDPLLGVLQPHLLGGADATTAPPIPRGVLPAAVGNAPVRAFVEVAVPGWVQITRAMLDAAQFPVVSPHRLRLRRGSADVPMRWEGDADDDFEPGERLLFFAEPRFSRYADFDVWTLDVSAVPVPRMSMRAAPLEGLPLAPLEVAHVAEQNLVYTSDCACGRLPLLRDGDRWAWLALQRGQVATFTLALSPAPLASHPAELTVWMLGYTDPPADPDHRAQVWLNGVLLGESVWNGKQAVTATFTVSPGLLSASAVVTVALPGVAGISVEGMWVDALQVRYRISASDPPAQIGWGEAQPRAYQLPVANYLLDVTDPDQPQLIAPTQGISGVQFADPAHLPLPRRYALITQVVSPLRVRSPEPLNLAQGDYHIITHAHFAPALTPLIARRQAQGRRVVTQTVQAIYDHFGDGRPDPEAVRTYLAQRYFHDAPRPAYILLVGDGTLDPKRYRPTSPPTWLPPYLADVDPFLGETAADNRFVAVDGNDALPDMAIGRLPVNTLTEAQTVVAKILTHEDALVTGAHRRVLLVADNADAAGNFPAKASALAAAVPPTFTAVVAAMHTPAHFTETRQTLLNTWNSGAYVIAFWGHASPRQWAAERLFHRDDVASLRAASASPVVLGMSCFTARFQELQDALDETLLRATERGAVATWGSTGLSISSGHEPLAAGFIRALSDVGNARLGDAAFAGKAQLAAGSLHLDLLDTFTLLGDPAMPFNARFAREHYLPIVRR